MCKVAGGASCLDTWLHEVWATGIKGRAEKGEERSVYRGLPSRIGRQVTSNGLNHLGEGRVVAARIWIRAQPTNRD